MFKVNFSIPSFIPIKESFIYLGITIYKNIHKMPETILITFSLRSKMTFKMEES